MNSLFYKNKSYKLTKIVSLNNNRKVKLVFYIPKIITINKSNNIIINKPTFNPPKNYNLCFIKSNILVYYPKCYSTLSFNIINKMYYDDNYLYYNTLIEEYNPKYRKHIPNNSFSPYPNPIKTPHIYKNITPDIQHINYDINSQSFIPKKKEFNMNCLSYVPKKKEFNINSKSYIPKVYEDENDLNSEIFIPEFHKKNTFNMNCQSFIPQIYKEKKQINTSSPIHMKYKYNKQLNLFVPENYNLKKSLTPNIQKRKYNINSKSFTPNLYKQNKKNNIFKF